MKITRLEGATLVVLDKNGKVSLHLPYLKEEPPRHLEEFLVLLGLWEARDKQLIDRIYKKITLPKEEKSGKINQRNRTSPK